MVTASDLRSLVLLGLESSSLSPGISKFRRLENQKSAADEAAFQNKNFMIV